MSEALSKSWNATRRALARALSPVASALRKPAVWLPLAFLGAAGLGTAWGSWQHLCVDCPSVAQIHTWEPQQTSKIYDAEGDLIGELGIERRTPVSIDALPDHVPQAFVAIEDRRFYNHGGYDVRGLTRAVILRGPLAPIGRTLLGPAARAGGGSTITQQLARNMFQEQVGFEHSVERKLKELQVSLQLEEAYSKDQILEAYMNQVNLGVVQGQGRWGIQTAAQSFFGRNAYEVNPAEAALLAAVVNMPGRYNPFQNPDNALQRRNLVLDRMAREGFLTPEEVEEWQDYPLPDEPSDQVEGTAPYFQEWIRRIVTDRFGPQVYTAGLEIHTTLDTRMQEKAEEAMEQGFEDIEAHFGFHHPTYEDVLEAADEDEEGGEAPQTDYLQGLFVALDPGTGAVRALIGGRDFEHSSFNRVTQARRQPGSAFKTFVWASALQNRIPASHIVRDQAVVIEQADGSTWRPRNFTREFQGPMTLRSAFRQSVNLVAIRLASEEVGLETVAQTARRLGIRTDIPRVEAMAIGTPDIRPLEMAEAYSTFGNMGTRVEPNPIRRVESATGEVLWEPEIEQVEVMDPLAARLMLDLMQDVVDHPDGTATGGVRTVGGLPFEVPAAGKTGTTNNRTDVWFMGTTPNLQAGIWFGFDQPRQIHPDATGGGAAAPVWGRFMRAVYFGDEGPDPEALAQLQSGDFEESNAEASGSSDAMGFNPAGVDAGGLLPVPEPWPTLDLTTLEVDKDTGLLASEWCPPERRYYELFIPGTEPTEECEQIGSALGGR